jgi:hypothetical protein
MGDTIEQFLSCASTENDLGEESWQEGGGIISPVATSSYGINNSKEAIEGITYTCYRDGGRRERMS